MEQGEFGLVVARREDRPGLLGRVGLSTDGTPIYRIQYRDATPIYPGALSIVWYRPGSPPLLDDAPWYDDEVEVIQEADGEGHPGVP
jgi:hypothetical protein